MKITIIIDTESDEVVVETPVPDLVSPEPEAEFEPVVAEVGTEIDFEANTFRTGDVSSEFNALRMAEKEADEVRREAIRYEILDVVNIIQERIGREAAIEYLHGVAHKAIAKEILDNL